jgi:hypothetical protein
LAFVILSFFGGLGVLLYVAGWILVPAEGSDESIGEQWLEEVRMKSGFGIFLIAIALIILLISLDVSRTGFGWAVALLVLGVLLYRGQTPREPGDTANAANIAGSALAAGPATTAAATPRPSRPRRVRRVRPPSMLGRYTVAAVLIGVGILALLDNAGALFPDARHYLALAVAVVGTGLLVGSFWGRSRPMIVVGLFLAFMMGIAAVGNTVEGFTDEVRTFAPSTVGDVSSTYAMDSGTLIVDLTGVEWSGQDLAIDAEIGAGQLEIRLPAGVGATVNARAGVGQVDVLGRSSEGLGVARSVTVAGGSGGGTVTVTARVGAGQIIVSQETNS